MMKKCSACGMAKDESCFASKNHYCRNCMAEMYKLKLNVPEYRKYLAKQTKIENTCGGIVARGVKHTKPGERKWSIENTVTDSHRFGDDKQEFLSVLKNQLAGE